MCSTELVRLEAFVEDEACNLRWWQYPTRPSGCYQSLISTTARQKHSQFTRNLVIMIPSRTTKLKSVSKSGGSCSHAKAIHNVTRFLYVFATKQFSHMPNISTRLIQFPHFLSILTLCQIHTLLNCPRGTIAHTRDSSEQKPESVSYDNWKLYVYTLRASCEFSGARWGDAHRKKVQPSLKSRHMTHRRRGWRQLNNEQRWCNSKGK